MRYLLNGVIGFDMSMFINNRWKAGSGLTFVSHNPATGEVLWEGREATGADINEAVSAAKEAFYGWQELSLNQRVSYLLNFSEALMDSKADLAETISKETGKPLWDSMLEVEGMIKKIEPSLTAYKERCPETTKPHFHAQLITRHRPHGVAAVLGPYNFPGHLPNGHIIPALLAGNTIVFKPSELTPLVAEKMVALWEKVHLPRGVLNLVQGGKTPGQLLICHPSVQALFFTGSYQTGQSILQSLGTQTTKIVALEMGGNNPLVVGEIRDFKAAAYAIIQSAYLSSGQRCTCARRLIIADKQKSEDLIKVLIKMIKTLSIGPYTNKPEPFMGPLIKEKQVHQLMDAQKNLESMGGKILVKMSPIQSGTGFISPGLMDVTDISLRPDEEIFGPFLQVIRLNNLKEAIDEANQTRFGLAAGLLSEKQEEYQFFSQNIKAGIVNWNTPLTGASSAAPFGGVKCSGNHRPSGYYASDYCSYPVASLESEELKIPESS